MAIQPLTAQSPTALGQQRWFFGMLAEVKASAADTAGQYTLLEITAPPGLETPLDRFTVGPEGARMLWVLTPGGFENFVEEASVPAAAPIVPPPSVVPPENVAEIVRRHGNELLPG
jgi:hypothetical protein